MTAQARSLTFPSYASVAILPTLSALCALIACISITYCYRLKSQSDNPAALISSLLSKDSIPINRPAAIFTGLCLLGALIALSVGSVFAHQIPVWVWTGPFAVISIARDIIADTLEKRKQRKNYSQGNNSIENLRQIECHGTIEMVERHQQQQQSQENEEHQPHQDPHETHSTTNNNNNTCNYNFHHHHNINQIKPSTIIHKTNENEHEDNSGNDNILSDHNENYHREQDSHSSMRNQFIEPPHSFKDAFKRTPWKLCPYLLGMFVLVEVFLKTNYFTFLFFFEMVCL